MHQLILAKSGGPHPYVDTAPEKVGSTDPLDPVAPRPLVVTTMSGIRATAGACVFDEDMQNQRTETALTMPKVI